MSEGLTLLERIGAYVLLMALIVYAIDFLI